MALKRWLSKSGEAETSHLPPPSELEAAIIATLRTIYDPEIPVNIYDLGLIYQLQVTPASGEVHIRMTLTAPACPVAQTFPDTVAEAVHQLAAVEAVTVELVWEPPWSKKMMSEAARLELGLI